MKKKRSKAEYGKLQRLERQNRRLKKALEAAKNRLEILEAQGDPLEQQRVYFETPGAIR